MKNQKVCNSKVWSIFLIVIFIQAVHCSASNLELPDSTITIDSVDILSYDIYDFSDVDVKPILLKKTSPKYPDAAREKLIEGKVVVSILIDENGDVLEAAIKKSVPLLDESCIDASKSLKFKPGKHKGKFVKVRMTIPYKFNL